MFLKIEKKIYEEARIQKKKTKDFFLKPKDFRIKIESGSKSLIYNGEKYLFTKKGWEAFEKLVGSESEMKGKLRELELTPILFRTYEGLVRSVTSSVYTPVDFSNVVDWMYRFDGFKPSLYYREENLNFVIYQFAKYGKSSLEKNSEYGLGFIVPEIPNEVFQGLRIIPVVLLDEEWQFISKGKSISHLQSMIKFREMFDSMIEMFSEELDSFKRNNIVSVLSKLFVDKITIMNAGRVILIPEFLMNKFDNEIKSEGEYIGVILRMISEEGPKGEFRPGPRISHVSLVQILRYRLLAQKFLHLIESSYFEEGLESEILET